MRKLRLFLFILTLYGCSTKQEKGPIGETSDLSKTKDSGVFEVIGDSIQVLPFDIQIDLDEKAEHKIIKQNETIIVSAELFGTPKDSVDSDLLTELGELYLARLKVELDKPGIATFYNIHISKASYEALADKDFTVLINVFSGRKSSNDNLLDCDILQQPISEVVGKTHTLKGKLIHE